MRQKIHWRDRKNAKSTSLRPQVIIATTGDHFNLPGHSLANMKVRILEKAKNNGDMYRKERERYFINKFNTYYEGINREY